MAFKDHTLNPHKSKQLCTAKQYNSAANIAPTWAYFIRQLRMCFCYFRKKTLCTGKSFSEALFLASNNPQYDDRLSMELQSLVHENYKLGTCCVHKLFFCFCFDIQNNLCTQHVLSLEFSCTELVIQWTLFCHIMG